MLTYPIIGNIKFNATLFFLYDLIVINFFLLLIYSFEYLHKNPHQIEITPDSIKIKKFLIFRSNYIFIKGDILYFSKIYDTNKYNGSKIKSYWLISKRNLINNRLYYLLKLNKSNEEISEIVTSIRNFVDIPIEIQDNTKTNTNANQSRNESSINSRISTNILNNRITRYSLNVSPSIPNIRFLIFNLIISISICLGLIKFYLLPGINSSTGIFFLYFYDQRLFFLILFLIVLLVRFYYIVEILNLKLNFDINEEDNELKITFKKFFYTKLLSIHQLNTIKNVTLVRTNIKGCFSIEINSSITSIIEYPLKYEDALQYSLLINKKIINNF